MIQAFRMSRCSKPWNYEGLHYDGTSISVSELQALSFSSAPPIKQWYIL